MFKNEYTFAALVILLSLVLSGAAFANGPVSNELDESDYADGQFIFDTSLHQVDRSYRPETVAGGIRISGVSSGPVSNELDESDYAQGQVVFDTSLHQTDRSFRPAAVPETRNLTVFTTGVFSSELDASDYDEITPTNHAKVESHRSDRLHCAEVDGSNQANRVSDCG